MEKSNTDKRLFPRVSCPVDLELVSETGTEHQFEAIDVSLTGVGLRFIEPPNPFLFIPGSKVEIGIPGLGRLKAYIRWSRGHRLGLKFSASLQDIISSWVGEVLAAKGVSIQDVTRVHKQIYSHNQLRTQTGT